MASQGQKNIPPGPTFPHVLHSTLHHRNNLHLVLGVRKGQKKVTLSQLLKVSPSPKDIVKPESEHARSPQKSERRSCHYIISR